MPLPGAVQVTLTAAGRKTLKKRVRGTKTPYRDRLRAQIVLAAARGRGKTPRLLAVRHRKNGCHGGRARGCLPWALRNRLRGASPSPRAGDCNRR